MTVRLASAADHDLWDRFITASPDGSFLQSWMWGDFQKELDVPFWRLVVEHNGHIQGVALVVRRTLPLGRCWLYVPHGPAFAEATAGKPAFRSTPRLRPVGAEASSYATASAGKPVPSDVVWDALFLKLTELAHSQKAVFLRLDPLWPDTGTVPERLSSSMWVKARFEVQPRHTLILDITRPEDRLLAGMREKTRYNIRLAARRGVRVRFSTAERDLEHFLRCAREVERRSPFQYHPDAYYRTMLRQPGVELGLAEYRDTVLAADIFITSGAVTTYAHGASGEAHRNVMAPQLLMWEAIRRARGRRIQRFDFYGVVVRGAHERHPWAGITRFKEGFGGRREDYVGAYDFVLDRFRYSAYNVVKQVRGSLR